MTLLKSRFCVNFLFFLGLVLLQTAAGLAADEPSKFDHLLQMTESENDRNLLHTLYAKLVNMPVESRTDEMKLMVLEDAVKKFESHALRSLFSLEVGRILLEQGDDSKAKKFYSEATKSDEAASLACSLIVNQHMNQGKFREALGYIDHYLKKSIIPEELRIELKCHRLYAMLVLGDECNIENELDAIELKKPENRVEFFQRLQRMTPQLNVMGYRNDALEIMSWIQSKMKAHELNPNFLNSFAFYYEGAGQPEKGREKRLLILEKFPETEDSVGQMSILVTQYMKENNLVSMRKAKNLLEQMLSHPKASDDYKTQAKETMSVVDRSIQNGFPKLDKTKIEEEVWVEGESTPNDNRIQESSPLYLGIRLFFVITGIMLILWGLYLAWTKEGEKK